MTSRPPDSTSTDPTRATLVLFDVDGTLVRTGGAGVRAMTRAFETVFRVPDAFRGISMAGRTDQAIVLEALERAGEHLDGGGLEMFRRLYVEMLREEMERPSPGKETMPGVREVLEALAGRPEVYVGLLTGNFAEAARVKLGYFNLMRYFAWGAFGDDAHDRNALVPIALARAADHGVPPVPRHRVVIVGDTPSDVACARAAGVRAVAVATGPFDVAALRASGADVVLPDLADTAAVLRALGVGEEGG